MVKPLLDEQPYNAIRIKEEIAPGCVLVADNREERLELGRLGKREHGRRQRVHVRAVGVDLHRGLGRGYWGRHRGRRQEPLRTAEVLVRSS